MIKIDFEFDTAYGKFRDALYLPDDHTYTDAEIQAMKEQRRDNWIAIVSNPPPPEPELDTIEINGVVYQRVN